MKVSSRWCVTVVLALSALACSDPVPQPAQGAFLARVGPPSSPKPDKACPSSSFTYDVPVVRDTNPAEQLSDLNYAHKIVDGEKGSKVSCNVRSSGGGFAFSGSIELGARGLSITGGTLDSSLKGTATITITDAEKLSPPQLLAPTGGCTIEAVGNRLEVAPGHIWAEFNCAYVELAPTSSCSASGVFVLENCQQ